MKNTLLGFSLLFLGLIFNACVEKSINTNTNQQIVPITSTPKSIPVQTPIVTSTRNIVIPPSTTKDALQLKTVQGSILTIQERSNGFVFPQYQNKIVLLQIFGQDCPYCFKEMPIINRVKEKHVNNLQIIAIQAQDPMTKETASRLIQSYQMDYPVIDKDEAKSLLHFMQKTYGWTGILPYMLIIKNGVTEYSFSGSVSYQELDEAVQSLI